MIKTTVLNNGVRVVTQRVENMHTVSIGIWVASGTRHETPELNGVAHFIEHLLFKGTENRTARQISMEFDSIGGVLNAFTGHEYVCYYAKVLAKFLPRITELLTDIFLNSTFPSDEIERERKVILQEIKMRDDTPDEYIHDRFHQNFWKGHSLGYCILGSESTISALTRDQIVDYKHSRYRPEDIIVSAAGNVCHEELVDLIEEALSGISSAWLPAVLPVASCASSQINLCERYMEQSLMCLGTHALSQGHEDRFAQYLLNTILGGGMSSRLFQEIREKKGLAYSIYSYIASHADCGALVVFAGTELAHSMEVFDISMSELRKLKHEPVSSYELDSAKEQLKGKILMSLENSESMMIRLAKNAIYLGRQQTIEDILAGFDAVTVDDVLRLGGCFFDNSCIHLEIMGKTSGFSLTSDQLVI